MSLRVELECQNRVVCDDMQMTQINLRDLRRLVHAKKMKKLTSLAAFKLHAINQSINVFNVLGGNWDPTDKKFSSVHSYRQDLLPTCKAFPKEIITCIWFTQSHKTCNGTTVLQEA